MVAAVEVAEGYSRHQERVVGVAVGTMAAVVWVVARAVEGRAAAAAKVVARVVVEMAGGARVGEERVGEDTDLVVETVVEEMEVEGLAAVVVG